MRMSLTCAAVSLAFGSAAVAAPTATLDVEQFDFVWQFDGGDATANFDRYDSTSGAESSDGTNEWSLTPTPVSGAIAISNAALSNEYWEDAAFAAGNLNAANGYTVEYRVRATPSVSSGNDGGLTVDAGIPDESGNGGSLAAITLQHIDKDTNNDLGIYWDLGAIGPVFAEVPADEFVTLRIAATPDATTAGGLSFSLYVNGGLVGDDLSRERAWASRRMLMGDVGGGARGDLTVDTVGFTPGAFAPVPEPGSVSLLSLMLSGCLLRRRRSN